MKLHFFKKRKTGWELPSLTYLIKTHPAKFKSYVKTYPLSALNVSKTKFVIIRKFAAREFEGKIDMLNAPDTEGGEHYPISHFGMVLVAVSDDGVSGHNVILPNDLKYERVELDGETLFIHHSKGITATNFKELNSLWTLENFSEEEILARFDALKNHTEKTEAVEKHRAVSIENDFFGLLKHNKALESFDVRKDDIDYSFSNTGFDQLQKNINNTFKLIEKLTIIENEMVDEMLVLKNDSWLEEGDDAISKTQFQKHIKLHSVSIYEDGSVELYYKANDLFWGHDVQTSLDHQYKYESSTLVG